jgi:predicted dehydrogenase
MDSLRIGILGAATIAPQALVKPATQVPGVSVVAVAARDPERAQRFANRHGIARVYDDYAGLVAADDLDAVYIPLPNGLHGAWTVRAVEAGKHVLCEKPFTANAQEARTVADAVSGRDRVVMEAFHYRYHPLTARILELVRDGAIGTVRHVEAHLCFPLPRFSDIRYNLDLAGGATMDAGCYVLHALRTFGPGEPAVRSARARLRRPEVDRAMEVEVAYPSGATGRGVTSLWSSRLVDVRLRIDGDAGSIRVLNFVVPQLFHRLTIRTSQGRRTERVSGDATYTYQLRAFHDAVTNGAPVLTDARDAVTTMELVDATYRAAGLAVRGPTPVL